MGHHDCKCSKNKHKHSKCNREKTCVDRSLVTQLPNALSNATNEKLNGINIIPADPIIAVGPKSVISMVNKLISIHRKDTMEEIFVGTTSDFWAELGSDQFGPGDVYTVYDEFSKRFFLLAFELIQISATDFITLIWVAVSKNNNPQNGDDFFKYIYVAPNFADYPKMAVDREALYITSQDFDPLTVGFLGHTVAVFDKTPLVDGSSSPSEIVPAFSETFPSIIPGITEFIFPIQPRPSQKEKCPYVEKVLLVKILVNVPVPQGAAGDMLRVYQIKNVLTNPVVVFADVKVPEFIVRGFSTVPQPPPVIQATNEPIVGLEVITGAIISGVSSHNSIWANHCVLSDGLDRWVARWYEIDISRFLNENMLELVQSGNADPGGTTNQIFPSINVNKCGDMAIQFTLVGEDQYPAIAYTGRLKNDPKGTIRLPLEVPIGGNLYYQQISSGRNRWGDYSGLGIDPCDHETFWLFNMYPVAVNPVIGQELSVVADGVGTFNALLADYSPPVQGVVSGDGGLAEPNDQSPQILACAPLNNPPVDLTNKVGICRRGACNFTNKTTNVEAAGSIATIVVSTGDALVMAGPPTGNFPSVSINKSDGDTIINAILASEDPINVSIEAGSPILDFGSNWTTFIGAFKIDKSSCKDCKELNAPQTDNLLSIDNNSATTITASKESFGKSPVKTKTIKKVSMKVTIKNGKKIRSFIVEGEVEITLPIGLVDRP